MTDMNLRDALQVVIIVLTVISVATPVLGGLMKYMILNPLHEIRDEVKGLKKLFNDQSQRITVLETKDEQKTSQISKLFERTQQ